MNVSETIQFLRANALTYCGRPGKLETVHEAARSVEGANVPGIFLEAGVAMGGSAIVIAKTKAPERELRLYDVFEMLPPPSANDDAKSHEV
ncbi:MAG TPA: TylF/MycF/NovP-related O-methyltransferase, partial [Usitatibacter sp.]|nr:TylF/MycF/NovP-related O-methyltransferase [Usitatibacter sp.]